MNLKSPSKDESYSEPKKHLEPFFFIENLYLMYSKSTLLRMSTEANFEDAFDKKQNRLINEPILTFEIEIQKMIDKLKVLFSQQKGGSITLEKLKDKIRKRIHNINPRFS
jgi:hypothetical protein